MNAAGVIVRLFLAGAMAGSGFLVFLMLLNRRLILVRDGRLKAPVLGLAFAALVGGGLALAWRLTPTAQAWVAAAVLAVLAAGEVRRARIRRACAGSPPVDTVFHDVPLLKPMTTTDLVCHRYEAVFPEWAGPPFRIAHLSDFHANPAFDEGYYREALARAESFEPDFAFFTGDFVTRSVSIPIVERFMRRIGRLGDYAVLGNHDHWTDPARIVQVLENAGIRVLTARREEAAVGDHRLQVIGCDYKGYSDISIPPTDGPPGLRLALCHTPDAIYALARSGVSAVFAGHNHAGQARVPGLGALVVPSRFGRRFDHGHFVIEGTHLFVSSGVGAATPPVRFYCQPDIFIVDIRGV